MTSKEHGDGPIEHWLGMHVGGPLIKSFIWLMTHRQCWLIAGIASLIGLIAWFIIIPAASEARRTRRLHHHNIFHRAGHDRLFRGIRHFQTVSTEV